MIAPLKSMYVTGEFGEPAQPGTGLPNASGVKMHIGTDLRASVGTEVYSMEAGTVSIVDNVGLKLVEIVGTKTIRYLHLDRNILGTGQKVSAGQLIGYSGNTGDVAAHLHVDVRKNGTTYNQSFYNYYNPMALINEQGGSQLMDTETKVGNQYYTLRGNTGTAAERKSWVGKSYEEFNSKARAEVDSREAHRHNLESAVSILTVERDNARAEVAKLSAEVLGLRDQTKILQAQIAEKDAQIAGMIEANKQLEAQHQAQIDELNKVIEIKDNEIKRLTTELANCSGEPLTWSQHLVLGLKGLIQALNPLSK
jgi:septal ring factor EnvC (AmiA/AmiB activator)